MQQEWNWVRKVHQISIMHSNVKKKRTTLGHTMSLCAIEFNGGWRPAFDRALAGTRARGFALSRVITRGESANVGDGVVREHLVVDGRREGQT